MFSRDASESAGRDHALSLGREVMRLTMMATEIDVVRSVSTISDTRLDVARRCYGLGGVTSPV
jgi:hypothetical protein